MNSMSGRDFTSTIAGNQDWPGAATLARQLALHLGECKVAAWLWLERHDEWDPFDECRLRGGKLAVATRRLFVVALVEEKDGVVENVHVESVPLGRLRSLTTYESRGGRVAFSLEFAGPVFGWMSHPLSPASGTVAFGAQADQFGGEAEAFLRALADLRGR